MHKRSLSAVLILLAAAICFTAAGFWLHYEKMRKENNDYFDRRIQSEKEWIMNNRSPDGAIFTYFSAPDSESDSKRYVNPYFSCTAARGLLLGDAGQEQLAAVRAYLDWHTAHLDADGGMSDYDYVADSGGFVWSSREDADSVDSYAALYLILLTEYYRASGDSEFILGLQDKAALVIEKLLSTQQADGLMYASAEHPVEYTMDNVEVNLALRDAVELCGGVYVSLSPLVLNDLCYALERNTKAIEELLWDSGAGEYLIGISSSGKAISEDDRSSIYPFWSAQLFPQLFGYESEDGARGADIYKEFCRSIEWTDLSFRHSHSSSYHCFLLCSAALNRDAVRVREYISALDAALDGERNYPFYCAESGWAITAYEAMKY